MSPGKIIPVIFLKKYKEFFIVFSVGAVIYSLIEIIFRGFTHWTMTLTGGTAFLMIHISNFRMKTKSLFLKCLAGSAIITALEFFVGCIVNRRFHLNVWDYSGQKFNILGQICPVFSAAWFLLTLPALYLSKLIKTALIRKK